MKMQYKLLSDDFDDHDTNASAVELIKSMANGTRTDHADALKFGLREGFFRTWPTPVESLKDPPSAPAKKPAGRSGSRW